ncbi:MAG: shikimate kinase [Planctomycetota bacterium]|nr:shikimate kinase [Planctomycetota bacterium]
MKTRKIALLGMMASGKTTLGKSLAARLSAPFLDLDAVLERIAGMPVADIFSVCGEDEFRALERMVVRELANRAGPLVMALGGGAYKQKTIREVLRGKAVTVYLRVDPAELTRRLENGGVASRPLLASAPDWRLRVRELADDRAPAYSSADIIFDADGNDVDALAEALAGRIGGLASNPPSRRRPEPAHA